MNRLDLNGTWHVSWAEAGRGMKDSGRGADMDPDWYLDVNVPGEMHAELQRHGLIDDPHVGLNILKARWVEDITWCYRRHFDAPSGIESGRAWLVFDELDLDARVFLNGELVGEHHNAFRPLRVEVTGRLIDGENRLVVQVASGLEYAAGKSQAGLEQKMNNVWTGRQWLRKPQFQAGWDWAGRMFNVGITGGVRLEWTADPLRVGQVVPLATLGEDNASGTLETRLFVEGLDEDPVAAEAVIRIAELGVEATQAVEVAPGEEMYIVRLEVPSVESWWPIGCGSQKLYDLEVVVRAGGREVSRRACRVGFRRVRVVQDPHPDGGRYFILEINGRRVFCKGGNFVPAEMIYSQVPRARYEALVDRAIEANFNLLRIWGGGKYEDDALYEICDERGILVWQEFIFACAKYPGHDEAFHNEVIAEATWNVRRLASHPSLVVWCGNNELEMGTWDWDYRKGLMFPDHAIFHFTLAQLMRREDPTRFYWPSSPHSLEHEHPNADHTGDQHPWSLGFVDRPEMMDFTRYRQMRCRFPNEGGFLGPNSLPTTRACLVEGDEKVGSLSWQVHDNTFFNDLCRHWLGRGKKEMTVAEHTYWGGLLHGEALREYCESFRRKMYDSASAIFWMYNDAWPCTRSWTIVDYYLRRTPAFHPVRRAMAPVHVILAEEDGEVVVFGVNDTDDPVEAALEWGVFELAGAYPTRETSGVRLEPNAATRLASFASDRWAWRDRSMAFGVLRKADGTLIARNRLFEGFWKDLAWPAAEVGVRVEGGRAVFSCEAFAVGVCLDLDGERALADNFFDVYPGMDYAIDWSDDAPPAIVRVGNLAPSGG